MARREYAGGAVDTTLGANLSAGATSITIADATGWPTGSGGKFAIDVDYENSSYEKILVLSRSGTTLTLSAAGDRGYDDTSDTSHTTGATVRLVVTAIDLDEANAHVNNAGAVKHTQAALADDSVGTAQIIDANITNAKLAASGLDISKFDQGVSTQDTTGNAATATTATTATSATSATTATTATTLATGRTFSISGDGTGTSAAFDGSANATIPLTLGSGVVGNTELAANSVGSSELQTDSVNTDEIAASAVTATELANGAVTNLKMANDSVGTNELIDANVTAAKVNFTWSTHVPTWGGTTSFESITNNYFRYIDMGGLIIYRGRLSLAGAADISGSIFSVDLPVDASANYRGIGSARYFDSSGGSGSEHYVGVCVIIAADEMRFYTSDAGTNGEAGGIVGNSVPFNWATGDSVEWTITYEAG